MSDEELRERERRWLITGALEDGVALLRERLRAGSLPPDRLELAAWAGSAAASQTLASPVEAPEEPERWVQGLLDLDPGEASRCALEIVVSTGLGPSVEPSASRQALVQGLRLAHDLIADTAPSEKQRAFARWPWPQPWSPSRIPAVRPRRSACSSMPGLFCGAASATRSPPSRRD